MFEVLIEGLFVLLSEYPLMACALPTMAARPVSSDAASTRVLLTHTLLQRVRSPPPPVSHR
jgi:hypothetical protein